MPTPVTRWITSDSKEHLTEELANAHEAYLQVIRHFPEIRAGSSNPDTRVYQVLTHLFERGHIRLAPGSL